MKKLILLLSILISFTAVHSQDNKIASFGFTRAIFIKNDTSIAHIKTYTNVDVICGFIYIATCSDTLYHYLIKDSKNLPLNRIILEKKDSINYCPVYRGFKDTIRIEINYKREIRLTNGNRIVHLYNK